jgi:hypothetical protein
MAKTVAESWQVWGQDSVWGQGCLLGVPLFYSLALLDKASSFVILSSQFTVWQPQSHTLEACQSRRIFYPSSFGHGFLSPKKT